MTRLTKTVLVSIATLGIAAAWLTAELVALVKQYEQGDID
jgi:hypothetical protein